MINAADAGFYYLPKNFLLKIGSVETLNNLCIRARCRDFVSSAKGGTFFRFSGKIMVPCPTHKMHLDFVRALIQKKKRVSTEH